ncbi:hypothetical protein MET9862_03175 [Methylobacterium symbioticum]|uniref:Uncharacterized protein n=1 Tax=Methylobacterium symbioticum TaxID=2584084 RepID=A0A509EGI2_9HYPH|nr:hypothetical protein MET9862_03175 [Methylobacterium symbioticum]
MSGLTATVRTRRGSPKASRDALPGVTAPVVEAVAEVDGAARVACAMSIGCSSRLTMRTGLSFALGS